MQAIEKTKNEANQKFSAGDVAGAIELYHHALVGAEGVTDGGDILKGLRVILHSNLSNAYCSTKQYDEACAEATKAIALDPVAIKPRARYVQARRMAGFAFDAYVYHLRNFRPLLRELCAARKITHIELDNILAEVEQPLNDALGLSRVSPDFELVPYAGGVAMVSRRHFKANEVLFVENQYPTTLDEASLNDLKDLTTDKIAVHFARHLRPEQQAKSETWVRFRREFYGAWPRSPEEIDKETRDTVGAALREALPGLPADTFEDLLVTSLMCRYNCFHSGFFRTCALANHSCRANIAMKYSARDKTVTMITVSDIAPGELMNVKYVNDAHFMLGLGKRRELLRSWLFWCSCERCAEDNMPDAPQEQIRCPHCHECFVHLPLPGDHADTKPEEVDPILRTEVACPGCQAVLSWSQERRAQFRASLPDFASAAMVESEQLRGWMQHQLSALASLQVHPFHWVYRMLFYFYCVSLCGVVGQCADRLLQPASGAAIPASQVRMLLGGFALKDTYMSLFAQARQQQRRTPETSPHCYEQSIWDDEVLSGDSGGCDALQALVMLWHLIRPFYPLYEMWAVHNAICQMVLLTLVLQDAHAESVGCNHLSSDKAVLLLGRHGEYIGEPESRKWLACFNQHKGSMKSGPPLAKVKKALKIK